MKSLMRVLCFFLFANLAYGAQSGPVVHGRSYVEILKTWADRTVTVETGNKGQIYIYADTGLGQAVASTSDTKNTRERLEKAVSKAIEWAKVAQENKADTEKQLGCFDYEGSCGDRTAEGTGMFSFSFFAANGGKQTDLILNLVDYENEYKKAVIYIPAAQMGNLLAAIKAIEDTKKKDNANKKKSQSLFK